MSKTRTITPNPQADFMPVHQNISPFRAWCQKVLPLVYDDSLSYYELLCKVLDTLNKTVCEVLNLGDAYDKLEDYVNHYFDNLDVQEEINNKLEQMFEDGKLNELLNLFIPYCTPQMFGAKGDGVTDDTEAFNNAIKYGTPIIVPNGEYLISHLNITTDTAIIMCDKATLSPIKLVDSFITFNYSGTGESIDTRFSLHSMLIGGTIDCKYLASTALTLQNYLGFTLENVIIQNFTGIGLKTGGDGTNGANLYAKNVYIKNLGNIPLNTIGINNLQLDNSFINVTIRDVTTAVYDAGHSKMIDVHPWLSTSKLFEGSTAFVVAGYGSNMDACTSDTFQVGVETNSELSLNGFRFVINKDVIPNATLNSLGSTIFKCGTSPHLLINNLFIDGTGQSNIKMFSDEFYNANINNNNLLYFLKMSNVFIPASSSFKNVFLDTNNNSINVYTRPCTFDDEKISVAQNTGLLSGSVYDITVQFQVNNLTVNEETIIGQLPENIRPVADKLTFAIPIGINITTDTNNIDVKISTDGNIYCISRGKPATTSYRISCSFIVYGSLNSSILN